MTTTSAPKPLPNITVGDRFRIVIRDERPPFVVTKVNLRTVIARGLPDPEDTGDGQIIDGAYEGLTMTFPRLKVEQAIALTRLNGWVL